MRVAEVRPTLAGAENCPWICPARGVGGLDKVAERSKFSSSSRPEKLSCTIRPFNSSPRSVLTSRLKDCIPGAPAPVENTPIPLSDSSWTGTPSVCVSTPMVLRHSREVTACRARSSSSASSVVGRRSPFLPAETGKPEVRALLSGESGTDTLRMQTYGQFSTELQSMTIFQNGSQYTENFLHQCSLGKQGQKNEKLHLPRQWNSFSLPSFSTYYNTRCLPNSLDKVNLVK